MGLATAAQNVVDRHKEDTTNAEYLALCDGTMKAHEHATHYIAWFRMDRTATDTYYSEMDDNQEHIVKNHSTTHRRILRLELNELFGGFCDPRTARISQRAAENIQRGIAEKGYYIHLYGGHHSTFVKLSAYGTHPDLEAAWLRRRARQVS